MENSPAAAASRGHGGEKGQGKKLGPHGPSEQGKLPPGHWGLCFLCLLLPRRGRAALEGRKGLQ